MTDYKNTTLIIAGHGSSKATHASRPARLHADHIRAKGIFGEVRTVFWKEAPKLSDALRDIRTERAVIVPNLACSGYINQTVMPREMGLSAADCVVNGIRVQMAPPVGEHPHLPRLIGNRLNEVIEERSLDPDDTTVFLVAHGNSNPDRPISHDTTVMMATRIYQTCPVQALLPAFLEEKPFLHSWKVRARTKNVIVLPFMIAAGVHGATDIPNHLEFSSTDEEFFDMITDGTPIGPKEIHGHHVWLMRAMGSHPKIADFIADLAITEIDRSL